MLGFYVARNKAQALTAARQLLRFAGAGHSAAIHCRDPAMAVEYGAAVEVYRVVVNAPCSQGAAGFGTTLGPTFTIGTGFFGRSSIGENIIRNISFIGPWSRGPRRWTPRSARETWRAEASGSACRGARRRGAGQGSGDAAWTPQRRYPERDLSHCCRRAASRTEELTMAELRSFIFIDQLQPQTLGYMATWIRGSLPRANVAAQIIEVAPGLDIEALTDVAVKHSEVQAGILVVERQYGYLEFHSRSTAAVKSSAQAVLNALGGRPEDARKPQILASHIVTRIDPQHAFLINRNKLGSMILGGESLYIMEMEPASYAVLATNAAEKRQM